MEDFISYINGLSQSTLMVVGILVIIGGLIMQQIVDSKTMTAVFMIAFQTGALVVNFVFTKFNLTLISNPETNLIVLSTIGMCVGLLTIVLLMRSYSAAASATRPKLGGPH